MWVALELRRRGGGHRPWKEAVEQGGTGAIVAAPTGLRRPCRSRPRPPTLPPSPRHSRRPPLAGEGGAGTIVVVPTGLCRPRRSHLHPHAAHVILRRPCRSCRHRLHPRTALKWVPHCREERRRIGEKWVKKKGRKEEEEGVFGEPELKDAVGDALLLPMPLAKFIPEFRTDQQSKAFPSMNPAGTSIIGLLQYS
ncbi:hypothetical protein [Oryza sativa Japonica Group]|uniref:Uncharacterized protein n=1 Tax=Oryza sativa subsp. japonica TaxID=39947 RepID=Q5N8E7_ORYSJ|nr:hypothetical protein [Oryza sativa Japonica Group]BAD82259.1 hypothetical protein [Oryza sativa Japonica Group]